jgi:hypothetical protein
MYAVVQLDVYMPLKPLLPLLLFKYGTVFELLIKKMS